LLKDHSTCLWLNNDESGFWIVQSLVLKDIIWFVLMVCLLLPQLHIQAVLCVLLATFTGFGATMFGKYVIVEIMRWRRRWIDQPNEQRGSQDLAQPHQQPTVVDETVTNPNHLPSWKWRSRNNAYHLICCTFWFISYSQLFKNGGFRLYFSIYKVCQLFYFVLFLGIRNGCTRRLTTHLAWNTASFISTQPGAIPTDLCQGQK